MKIIILRIPQATSNRELMELVESLLEKKYHLPFTKRAEIIHCDILIITNPQGIQEHHGLLVIHPEKAAAWLIKHLRGQRLHNKPIYGRQYFDRTKNDSSKIPDDERRRPGLRQENRDVVHLDVHGYEQFTQEHKG
ncbi:MAG: hypothetical protein ABW148_13455 [Sedimenticola sp.]